MATTTVSSYDGSLVSVNAFVKDPVLVRKVVQQRVDLANLPFNAIFRNVPAGQAGVVMYETDVPMNVDGIEVVQEYGEIPVVQGKEGPKLAATQTKMAAAIELSYEMVLRNNFNAFDKRLRQVTQAHRRVADKTGMDLLTSGGDTAASGSGVPKITATSGTTSGDDGGWSDSTSPFWKDIAKAKSKVSSAVDSIESEPKGFEPDLLVVNKGVWDLLGQNESFAKLFAGNVAGQNPQLTGQIPNAGSFYGLTVLATPWMSEDNVVVCQSKAVGFVAEERPLSTTPMYEIRQNEVHRADTSRTAAYAVDEPKAACIITGVSG